MAATRTPAQIRTAFTAWDDVLRFRAEGRRLADLTALAANCAAAVLIAGLIALFSLGNLLAAVPTFLMTLLVLAAGHTLANALRQAASKGAQARLDSHILAGRLDARMTLPR